MGEQSPKPASTPTGAVFLSYASEDAEAAQRICATRAGQASKFERLGDITPLRLNRNAATTLRAGLEPAHALEAARCLYMRFDMKRPYHSCLRSRVLAPGSPVLDQCRLACSPFHRSE